MFWAANPLFVPVKVALLGVAKATVLLNKKATVMKANVSTDWRLIDVF